MDFGELSRLMTKLGLPTEQVDDRDEALRALLMNRV
jgi:hypothetical protein